MDLKSRMWWFPKDIVEHCQFLLKLSLSFPYCLGLWFSSVYIVCNMQHHTYQGYNYFLVESSLLSLLSELVSVTVFISACVHVGLDINFCTNFYEYSLQPCWWSFLTRLNLSTWKSAEKWLKKCGQDCVWCSWDCERRKSQCTLNEAQCCISSRLSKFSQTPILLLGAQVLI